MRDAIDFLHQPTPKACRPLACKSSSTSLVSFPRVLGIDPMNPGDSSLPACTSFAPPLAPRVRTSRSTRSPIQSPAGCYPPGSFSGPRRFPGGGVAQARCMAAHKQAATPALSPGMPGVGCLAQPDSVWRCQRGGPWLAAFTRSRHAAGGRRPPKKSRLKPTETHRWSHGGSWPRALAP